MLWAFNPLTFKFAVLPVIDVVQANPPDGSIFQSMSSCVLVLAIGPADVIFGTQSPSNGAGVA